MSVATPQDLILGIVNNHWQSCCVGAAAQLELADLLADGPLHVDVLAERTKTHAPSLYRMLRALESTGIGWGYCDFLADVAASLHGRSELEPASRDRRLSEAGGKKRGGRYRRKAVARSPRSLHDGGGI